MKRFITIMSLGVSLAVVGGAAAQEINADGNSGKSSSGTNPAVNANGPTVVYGDLNPGAGNTVYAPIPGANGNISATDGNASTLGPGNASAAPGTVNGGVSGTSLLGPDGTYSVSDTPSSDVSLGNDGVYAPAPEPLAAPVEDTTTTEPVVAESAPAVDSTDADGDNYPDAQELEMGLDPTNIDTDGDGVADGDEITIYATDPFTFDSDGDGLSDGEELYNTRTDPLVWDTASSGETTAAADGASDTASSGEVTGDATTLAATDGDSDGDRLADADEAVIGTDPSTPDTDGDGYYDGDEAALGSDPFDPNSAPTA